MHDAAEAYIGDIVRPLKHAIHAFNPSSGYEREDIPQVESRILKAIGEALDFDPAECEAGTVKQADLVMLMTERRDLFDLAASTLPWPGEWPEPHKRRLVPWTSRQAECEFLYAFRELKSIAAARA